MFKHIALPSNSLTSVDPLLFLLQYGTTSEIEELYRLRVKGRYSHYKHKIQSMSHIFSQKTAKKMARQTITKFEVTKPHGKSVFPFKI